MDYLKEIIINKNMSNQTVLKGTKKILTQASDSFIHKMIRKKNITLNGKKTTHNAKLVEGDVLRLFFSEETFEKFSKPNDNKEEKKSGNISKEDIEKFEKSIIYEDNDIIIINKWAGILSQKAKPEDISIDCLLKNYVGVEEYFSPGICNRLDRNTSGIVVGGKTLGGLQMLSEIIKKRECEKYYLCFVSGEVKEGANIDGYLVKNNDNKVVIYDEFREGASRIETEYIPLASDGDISLLKINLKTGKTHQIRAHLAYIGHPVLGDRKYNNHFEWDKKRSANVGKDRELPKIKRQLLHSYEFVFPLMNNEFGYLSEKIFKAPVPHDFKKMEKLRQLLLESDIDAD